MKIVMKMILVVLVLLINFGASAGNILPAKLQAPSDPGGDPGSVPIDDFTYVLILGGIVLGGYLIKKRKVSLKR